MIVNGTIISGKYRIIEHVDSGGMSDIYKAMQLKGRKTVALKFLKDEFSKNDEIRENLEKEAEVFHKLNSKYIVNYIESGEHKGLPYIAMDFIEGPTLKRRLEEKMEIKEAIEIARKVIRGLGHAHQKNIIHGDLKSHNIVIDKKGDPYIIDFGIGEKQKENSEKEQVVGSVHYLSPEQAKSANIDKRSDIYSFGIILYEMCTGTLPFVSDDPLTVALMHIHQKPKEPKELNPEIPDSLNAIILKAIEKDPDDRYQNAIEILSDLNHVYDDTSGKYIKKKKNNSQHWLSKQRNRIILLVSIIVLVAVSVILGWQLISFLGKNDVNEIYMPNLIGKSIEEAESMLENESVTVFKTEVINLESEGGIILNQEPSAGTEIKKGDVVILSYSSEGKIVEMPSVMGMILDGAEQSLGAFGLNNINIEWRTSDTAAQNEVVEQFPAQGEQIKTSEKVTLVVNTVMDKYIENIPYLIGMELKDAIKKAYEKGISRVFVKQEVSGKDETVYQQSPEYGDKMGNGDMTLVSYTPSNNQYVAVMNIDDSMLKSGKRIRITVDREFDGVMAEVILVDSEIDKKSENAGKYSLKTYRPETESQLTLNLTIYIDDIAISKTKTSFFGVKS